ncbi:MAG: double-strand break repair protein AddB [Gemmobacter sp.]
MFPEPAPHLYALPPGADFPALVVRGLRARLAGAPPEAWAATQVFVNTDRMRDRIRRLLADDGAILLPRVAVVTDIGRDAVVPGLPLAVPPLRRRLELSVLIGRLLDRLPDLAPREALYDLADSLATLLDEMQGEGVPPERIAALDVAEHSAHWQRTRDFMAIVAPFFAEGAPPDAETRQRRAVEALATRWQADPPQAPVIVAGSTGSRGTTLRLMQAVAALPQGALILPGFDFDLPAAVWAGMGDALTAEDHPQFRYRRLLDALGCGPEAVRPWLADAAPAPARNRLISLSLRPAPVTDQWLVEGAALPDLTGATDAMTLIEAEGPRAEALAIAVILREVAEHPLRTAILVTADRALARRVTAALDRWGIRPDDSAGRPLALSPPGRLLRQVAGLGCARLAAEDLLALLKHPLVASGPWRGRHLRLTRALERRIRRHGPAYPRAEDVLAFAVRSDDAEAAAWAGWLAACLTAIAPRARPLVQAVEGLLTLADMLVAGPDGAGLGALWAEAAGDEARRAMQALREAADAGGEVSPPDMARLLDQVMAGRVVREGAEAHPRIGIRGPREARMQGADLVILGGLTEGGWPAIPPPDPWMNRAMRHQAGLLVPERQVGLSAHDYQQAVGAREVVMTRARRDAEAETVPSRWLNRLVNLMAGLPDRRGPEALAAMRARGERWLAIARAADDPGPEVARAVRPAPAPPLDVRPRKLSVTAIQRLIRDPYAIYAAHVLGLRPLDPLRAEADARLRGSVLHLVLERFARGRGAGEGMEEARARLVQVAADVLAAEVPWPAARLLWQARLERSAEMILSVDARLGGQPAVIEATGAAMLPGLGFTLTARADRIDEGGDGRVHVLDYKTGAPPSRREQEHFDKQLLLTAAIVERGGFADLGGPRAVETVAYLGLGSTPKLEVMAVTPEMTGAVWDGLAGLIGAYLDPARGYTARRAMQWTRFASDYDHLARFGEWQMTDAAVTQPVGA